MFKQKNDYEIMTPEEAAKFLHKSVSRVYKHWQELGGRKLGGSLFLPEKEDLHELLFSKGKGVRYDFTLKGIRHSNAWFKTKAEAKQAEAKKRRRY
ncbi:MAG: hypothetical protein ACMUHX_07950 [bacterium]